MLTQCPVGPGAERGHEDSSEASSHPVFLREPLGGVGHVVTPHTLFAMFL